MDAHLLVVHQWLSRSFYFSTALHFEKHSTGEEIAVHVHTYKRRLIALPAFYTTGHRGGWEIGPGQYGRLAVINLVAIHPQMNGKQKFAYQTSKTEYVMGVPCSTDLWGKYHCQGALPEGGDTQMKFSKAIATMATGNK